MKQCLAETEMLVLLWRGKLGGPNGPGGGREISSDAGETPGLFNVKLPVKDMTCCAWSSETCRLYDPLSES